MSKNQNSFESSPEKLKPIPTKIAIKFFPKQKVNPQKTLNHKFSNSSYSLSKINTRTLNSTQESKNLSLAQGAKNDLSTSLFKQNTQSSDSMSEKPKEIISIENRLNSIAKENSAKEKYEEIIRIWDELYAISSSFHNVLSRIKNGVEDYVQELESSLERSAKANKEHDETSNTLKILKKRFQKLAFENLEVNNKIIEKENAYIRTKEKLKLQMKNFKIKLAEKDEITENLSTELQATLIQLDMKKYQLEKYKSNAACLAKFLNEAKANARHDSNFLENLMKFSQYFDEKEAIGLNNLSSIDLEPQVDSILIPQNWQCELSFLSASENELFKFNP